MYTYLFPTKAYPTSSPIFRATSLAGTDGSAVGDDVPLKLRIGDHLQDMQGVLPLLGFFTGTSAAKPKMAVHFKLQ